MDIFFYGLFMDEEVLRAKGIEPRERRRAVVPGYRLKIGQRATLVPYFLGQAYGMVFALTDREIESLYSESGLEKYRPQSVMAFFENGSVANVTAFVLDDKQSPEEPNNEYVDKLRRILSKLGFPSDFTL
jgi:Gamma-glutamyl cyclotransferase, AIG2-like